MKKHIAIRPAEQSDKEAVFEFCQHSFDWGDYIFHVWNRWLEEENAQLFTALVDAQPVGIMRISIPKPGEAWLQAARTHPDHRRRGIATALTNGCLKWAKDKGVKIARLATDSDNYAAQKTLRKLHFTQVADFLVMKCEKLQTEKTQRSAWAQESDTEKIWSFLTRSNIFKKSAELYTVLFTWKTLDKKDLAQFISNKQAIAYYSDDGTIGGLVLIDESVRDVWQEKPFQTCYIDGDQRTIADMMKLFKTYSHQRQVTNVYAFACNTSEILEALARTDFSSEDSTTELIYQKKLAP